MQTLERTAELIFSFCDNLYIQLNNLNELTVTFWEHHSFGLRKLYTGGLRGAVN